MNSETLIITTRLGLEGIVKNELKVLGYDNPQVSNGKIDLEANLADIAQLNLWLRCADRVYLRIGAFKAETFDELFEKTKALPWQNVIPKNGRFDVNGKSSKSKLMSVRSSQSIIKKAIVEKLKTNYDIESLQETEAAYPIDFTIDNDMVTLSIDTSGDGLHKRGYRKAAGEAPLKETLAAGLVILSSWFNKNTDQILLDPFCGSGTILIEAAMLARNIAPGLMRGFAAEKWPIISDKIWQNARQQALDSIQQNFALDIQGFDIDKNAIEMALGNASIAGVQNDIQFEHKRLQDLWIDRQFGTVITNPPYGQRMSEFKAINQLYRTFNQIFKKKTGWSVFVLTADKKFPKYFKRSKPDRVRKLYNGNIEVNYYQYYAEK